MSTEIRLQGLNFNSNIDIDTYIRKLDANFEKLRQKYWDFKSTSGLFIATFSSDYNYWAIAGGIISIILFIAGGFFLYSM